MPSLPRSISGSDTNSYGTDSELDEIADGGALLSSISRKLPSKISRKGRKPRFMDFDCAECDSTPICAKGLCSRCYQRSRKQQLNAANAKINGVSQESVAPGWLDAFIAPMNSAVANINMNAPFNAGETLATLAANNRRRSFSCPHCHKLFYKPSQIARHVRVHTGEKPFACPHIGCIRSFSEKGNLRRHLKMHTGEKPFTCSTCGKKFSRRSHLADHVKAKNFESHHVPMPLQYAAMIANRAISSNAPPAEEDCAESSEDSDTSPGALERRVTAELVKLATPGRHADQLEALRHLKGTPEEQLRMQMALRITLEQQVKQLMTSVPDALNQLP